MAKIFTAQFNSPCWGCSDLIKVGETVTYAGDYLVHEECGYSGDDYNMYDVDYIED